MTTRQMVSWFGRQGMRSLPVVSFGAKRSPAWVVSLMGKTIGFFFYLFAPKERKQTIALFLERMQGSRAHLSSGIREFYKQYGLAYADWFRVKGKSQKDILSQTIATGYENLVQARAWERGVIFLLVHTGNLEAAGAYGASIGLPVMVPVEDMRPKVFLKWSNAYRERMGMRVLVVALGQGFVVVKKLLEHIKNKGAVAFLCDRNEEGLSGSDRLFRSRVNLSTARLAIDLARKTGAALIPVTTFSPTWGSYRVAVGEELELPPSQKEAMQVLQRVMEDMIRCAPMQWKLFAAKWPQW
jgi:lauroyl/myristoyl acyltransferase